MELYLPAAGTCPLYYVLWDSCEDTTHMKVRYSSVEHAKLSPRRSDSASNVSPMVARINYSKTTSLEGKEKDRGRGGGTVRSRL